MLFSFWCSFFLFPFNPIRFENLGSKLKRNTKWSAAGRFSGKINFFLRSTVCHCHHHHHRFRCCHRFFLLSFSLPTFPRTFISYHIILFVCVSVCVCIHIFHFSRRFSLFILFTLYRRFPFHCYLSLLAPILNFCCCLCSRLLLLLFWCESAHI